MTFCECINKFMRNLVPEKICTFDSILRADQSLRLSSCCILKLLYLKTAVLTLWMMVEVFLVNNQ